MLIPVGYEIKKLEPGIHFKDIIIGQNEDLIVWWQCGFRKNTKAGSQPLVQIVFKRFINGHISDERNDNIMLSLPSTTLGIFRIGTIWRNSICKGELNYEEKRFFIDFSIDKWKWVNFEGITGNSVLEPFPQDIHKLLYPRDRNWLLQFEVEGGGTLVVPCLEFFARYYGRSAELRRVLATYSWADIEGGGAGRLYLPVDEPEEEGKWKVRLTKRMVNDDVIFLAHVLHDNFANSAAKSIYSQLESGYNFSEPKTIFLKVQPWFQGRAEILVKGISYNKGNSFLGLQIIGGSDPEGVPIERDRENPKLVNEKNKNVGTQNAWAGSPTRIFGPRLDIVDLTTVEDPSSNTGTIEIKEPDFIKLGKMREVIAKRSANPGSTPGKKLPYRGGTTFSTGEPFGSQSNVGFASISAPILQESHGILWDVWKALGYLSRIYRNEVSPPEWYTQEEGFTKKSPPRLVQLRPFDLKEDVGNKVRNWVYLDSRSKQHCRGVLIARIKVCGTYIYFLEIERKRHNRTDELYTTRMVEESFCEYSFILENESNLKRWLDDFLDNVRRVKGRVQKLKKSIFGEASVFNHKLSDAHEVPQLDTIKKAIKNLGIVL